MVTCTGTWPGRNLCTSFSSKWLLPTLSRRNRCVLTESAASASSVCNKMYEQPSEEPWRYKTVPDNVAGNVMFGLVAKFASGPAPHLRVCLAGRASGFGQPHSLSPSEARPWCRPDSKFVVRQREPIEDLSGLRHVLSVNRKAGNEAFTSEFVSGSPVRFVCRGVGGPRILGMPPYPVSRQF